MTDSRHHRLESLFLQCVELPLEERAAFFDAHCAGDPALRAELEDLLRRDADADVPAAPPPSQIGAYRLEEKIGEGGFGEVYTAEQTAPVRRRVAIKILKAGMDSRAVLARFEAERQALALMDHPAIAKVFDAGATETGRPYFVMELVSGEPITSYCDGRRLGTNAQLALFVEVCRGIEHAHHKGVIHRDLKPSNILVTTLDGKPHPKVIDFGIAKATTAPTDGDAPRTLAGELLGTPEYMSPEQATSQGADVDTRSDVYSLGVVLYRLLTGRVPFASEKLRNTTLADMQRILLEEEPPKPSTLSGARDLRGDLDWIVLRALEKDRERRYPSAAAFADDVERHLRHEPVEAGPPTAIYRLSKLVRRHRALVGAAAAVFLALVAGMVTTSTQAVRAKRAEERARSEAEVATAVNDFLARMLAAGDPKLNARGRDVTIREIVDQASKELQNAPPASQRVEAGVRHTLGATYAGLGLYDEAEPHLLRAVQIREANEGAGASATLKSRLELATMYGFRGQEAVAESLLKGMEATARFDSTVSPELRVTYLELRGSLDAQLGRYPEADSTYAELVRIRRTMAAQNPGHAAELALSLGVHSRIKADRGELGEAEALAREAYDLVRKARPGDHHNVVAVGSRLANVLMDLGRHQEALELVREVVAMSERILGPEHPLVAEYLTNLASVQADLGRLDESIATFRRAREILDRQVHPESGRRATLMDAFATALQSRGDLEEALALRLEALDLYRKAYGNAHDYIPQTLNNIGSTYRLLKRYDDAARAFQEALPLFRAVHGELHPNFVIASHNLGKTRFDQGRYEEAERTLRGVMDLGAKVFPEGHPNRAILHATYGRTLAALGRAEEARAELQMARAGLTAALGPDHPRTKEVNDALAKLEDAKVSTP